MSVAVSLGGDHVHRALEVARKIAPQHTRDHRWVREDAATLRRLKRADAGIQFDLG
ncbi:hypothetical protein [Nonomuraea sp. NPDC050783]|uniref:hypothetical protein n=1 Tax=Nonomuraea sp. NPDC050783 TaxID=3154634 RepID=UPI0034657EB6